MHIRLSGIGCRAANLRTHLDHLSHHAARLGRSRHRVALGGVVVVGGPARHEAFLSVEDHREL